MEKAPDFDKTAAKNAANRIRATADYIEANPRILPTFRVQKWLRLMGTVNPLGVNWDRSGK